MTNNMSRVILLALAGAVGGLLVFAMLNPSAAHDEAVSRAITDINEVYAEAIKLDMVIACAIAGMLVIANEIGSPAVRIAIRVAMSVGIAAALGAIGGVVGQYLFGTFAEAMPIIGLLIGRTIGWAILGVGGGLSVGFVLGSWKRAGMGALGGLLGGGVGGIFFDVLGMVTGGGSVSRLIGFIAIGSVTGAAIAFVEEAAKQSWVTVLSGSREGKTYILTKPSTTIGRDELADIPLFGDPSIAKSHAVLSTAAYSVTLQPTGGPVLVNGSTAAPGTPLKDGDVIAIGRMSLRLNQKVGQHSYSLAPQHWHDPLSQYPAHQPVSSSQISVATGTITLAVIAGPYDGQFYQSGPGLLRIGRDEGCSIALPQDLRASRIHAEVTWDGANWSVRDAGSTNGLWVNSERVTFRLLAKGDHIGVGQTVLRVDGV